MRKLLYLITLLMVTACGGNKKTSQADSFVSAPDFDADSAFMFVKRQCEFGPRVMNSAAHDSCGDYIASVFKSYGAEVFNQYADSKLYDGTEIKMRNIIASVNPDADTHIIISGHWDSRPWADQDENSEKTHTPIDGANDGASSIGVMMEMARILHEDMSLHGDTSLLKKKSICVDFICWDAEDCGVPEFDGNHDTDESATWCLGSQYWSGVRHQDGYTARYGINLDMVGGNNTVFYKERYSLHYAPALVDKVWSTANKLGYSNYFSNETCGYVTDDHVQVNLGGIPCIDVIGADNEGVGFPETWHTTNDNIENINKQTLKAVGQTILTVLWNE